MLVVCLLVMSIAGLVGCGNTGPLFLPEKSDQQTDQTQGKKQPKKQ